MTTDHGEYAQKIVFNEIPVLRNQTGTDYEYKKSKLNQKQLSVIKE